MKRDDYSEIPLSDFEIRSMFEADDVLGIILKGHISLSNISSPWRCQESRRMK